MWEIYNSLQTAVITKTSIVVIQGKPFLQKDFSQSVALMDSETRFYLVSEIKSQKISQLSSQAYNQAFEGLVQAVDSFLAKKITDTNKNFLVPNRNLPTQEILGGMIKKFLSLRLIFLLLGY